MRHSLLFAVALAALALFISQIKTFAETPNGLDKTALEKEGFVRLFDGKTLEGWEGNDKIFHIANESVVAGTLKEKIPHNEFLCTKKTYANFELRLEAKLIGKGENAGVQFRTKRIPNHHEVSGFQCDMGVAGGKLIWGALYDESRRNKFLVTPDHDKLSKVFKADEFNTLRIRAEGDHIQIWVNDFLTCDYTEKDAEIAKSGIIALQIHGGEPSEATYRNIWIKELK